MSLRKVRGLGARCCASTGLTTAARTLRHGRVPHWRTIQLEEERRAVLPGHVPGELASGTRGGWALFPAWKALTLMPTVGCVCGLRRSTELSSRSRLTKCTSARTRHRRAPQTLATPPPTGSVRRVSATSAGTGAGATATAPTLVRRHCAVCRVTVAGTRTDAVVYASRITSVVYRGGHVLLPVQRRRRNTGSVRVRVQDPRIRANRPVLRYWGLRVQRATTASAAAGRPYVAVTRGAPLPGCRGYRCR